jgi:hypothetical protein
MPEGLLTGHQRAQPPSTSAAVASREACRRLDEVGATANKPKASATSWARRRARFFLILELNQPFCGLFCAD